MDSSSMHSRPYRALFGFALDSAFDFGLELPSASAPADLHFVIGAVSELPPPRSDLAYTSDQSGGHAATITAYGTAADATLRFPEVVFDLGPTETVCHLPASDYAYLARIQFLGMVMALWMELRGIPVLHASGTLVNGRAVGFLAKKTGGKTSLAASMVRAGHALLSDDLLPIEQTANGPVARPSYPQFRMEPDAGRHFVDAFDELPIVHPSFAKRRVPAHLLGEFHGAPAPLVAIYVPERVDGGHIEISPIPGVERVVELLRESFLPEMVAAFGLEPQRLRVLGNVAKTIPIKRLRYPSGFDHLPEVVRAIEADLRGA